MTRASPIIDSNGQLIKEWAERVRGLRERTVAEIAQVVVGMEHVTHQVLTEMSLPSVRPIQFSQRNRPM